MASPTSSSVRPVPRDRLAGISLCVLVEGGKSPAAFERLVTSLFTAGVGMLHIRDKLLPDAVLLDRVRIALTAARRHDPGAYTHGALWRARGPGWRFAVAGFGRSGLCHGYGDSR